MESDMFVINEFIQISEMVKTEKCFQYAKNELFFPNDSFANVEQAYM